VLLTVITVPIDCYTQRGWHIKKSFHMFLSVSLFNKAAYRQGHFLSLIRLPDYFPHEEQRRTLQVEQHEYQKRCNLTMGYIDGVMSATINFQLHKYILVNTNVVE